MSNQEADAALREGIAKGNILAIEQALMAGANAGLLVDNPFLPGNQPIYPAIVSASAYGNGQMIRLLLKSGADITAQAENGIGCLEAAQKGANPQETEALLQEELNEQARLKEKKNMERKRYPKLRPPGFPET